jgi:hypothetical protein
MNEDAKTYTWIKNFSKQMISELFVMVHTQKEQKDPSVLRRLLNTFLSSYVGSLVMTALSRTPAKSDNINSKKDLAEFTQQNLVLIKNDIAEAVALGMEAAVYNFSGKEVEYYCIIKPVAEGAKSNRVH